MDAGFQLFQGDTFGTEPGYRMVEHSGLPILHTGVTAETTIKSVLFPRIGKNGRLVITAAWSLSSNTNTRTMRKRLIGAGGGVGQVVRSNAITTALGIVRDQTEIVARDSDSIQASVPSIGGGGWGTSATTAMLALTQNLSAGGEIRFTGELSSAADFIQLEYYRVEMWFKD